MPPLFLLASVTLLFLILGLRFARRRFPAIWSQHPDLTLYRETLGRLPRRYKVWLGVKETAPFVFLWLSAVALLAVVTDVGARTERVPRMVEDRRIVMVNDFSGSMQSVREETLRRANLAFFEALQQSGNPAIRVGIVEFSDSAAVRLPLVRIYGNAAEERAQKIKKFRHIVTSMGTDDPGMGGGTELGEGVWVGLELIVRHGRRRDATLLARWQDLYEAMARSPGTLPDTPGRLKEAFGCHQDAAIVAFSDGIVKPERFSAAAVFTLARALCTRTYFISVEQVPADIRVAVHRTITNFDPDDPGIMSQVYEEIAKLETETIVQWETVTSNPWERSWFLVSLGSFSFAIVFTFTWARRSP